MENVGEIRRLKTGKEAEYKVESFRDLNGSFFDTGGFIVKPEQIDNIAYMFPTITKESIAEVIGKCNNNLEQAIKVIKEMIGKDRKSGAENNGLWRNKKRNYLERGSSVKEQLVSNNNLGPNNAIVNQGNAIQNNSQMAQNQIIPSPVIINQIVPEPNISQIVPEAPEQNIIPEVVEQNISQIVPEQNISQVVPEQNISQIAPAQNIIQAEPQQNISPIVPEPLAQPQNTQVNPPQPIIPSQEIFQNPIAEPVIDQEQTSNFIIREEEPIFQEPSPPQNQAPQSPNEEPANNNNPSPAQPQFSNSNPSIENDSIIKSFRDKSKSPISQELKDKARLITEELLSLNDENIFDQVLHQLTDRPALATTLKDKLNEWLNARNIYARKVYEIVKLKSNIAKAEALNEKAKENIEELQAIEGNLYNIKAEQEARTNRLYSLLADDSRNQAQMEFKEIS